MPNTSSIDLREADDRRRVVSLESKNTPESVDISTASACGLHSRGQVAFRGIQYGRIRQRFLKAELAPLWSGERDFFQFGPRAPQPFLDELEKARNMLYRGSENTVRREFDCLTLNVYAPDRPGIFPVFVYFHGGAFLFGSGADVFYQQRHGHSFPKHGVVAVTLNYRLGALGFLKVRDSNLGLWDQLLALQWINKYIACFGGDPNQVTVCGESAGAMSIGCHLVSPHSQPYFQRAILMSGAFSNAMALSDACACAQAFAREGGCSLSLLDHVSEKRILEIQWALTKSLKFGLMPFQPCIDGDFLPAHPYTLMSSVTKPVLLGYNKEDSRSFTFKYPLERFFTTKSVELKKLGRDLAHDRLNVETSACASSLLDDVKALGADSWRDAYRRIQNFLVFAAPVFLAADKLPQCTVYRWDYDNTIFGAAHSMQIPLLFETVFPYGKHAGLVTKFVRAVVFGWNDEDRNVAMKAIQSTFLQFVRGELVGESYNENQRGLLLSEAGVSVGHLWSCEEEKQIVERCKLALLSASRPYGLTARF